MAAGRKNVAGRRLCRGQTIFAEGDLGASSFGQKREFEFQMSV
jgi:hypothetical protein